MARATPPTAYPVVDPSMLAHTSVAAERAADASAAHASAQQSAGLATATIASATSASASTASMTAGAMQVVESKLAPHDQVLVPARRRGVPIAWLGAGGAIVVAIVLIVVLRGGSNDKPKPSAAPPPAVVEHTDPRPEVAAPPAPEDTARGSAIDMAPANGSATTAPPTPDPDEAVTPTPLAPKPKRVAFGGKKLVLDYDSAPAAPKATPDAAISSARRAYLSGNKRLFAGDADGAIRLYRQALTVYPGYVAGYRGLGLAYSQKGDKASALRALRTYVAAVPRAKDIPLIKKRIASLLR